MSTAEIIFEKAQALPEREQQQVLDFVEKLAQHSMLTRDEWIDAWNKVVGQANASVGSVKWTREDLHDR